MSLINKITIEQLQLMAETHGMVLQILCHGPIAFNYQDSPHGQRSNILRLCRQSAKGKSLLEVEISNGSYVLLTHRTESLTRKYTGRIVSSEWISGFIKNNSQISTSNADDDIQKLVEKKDTEDMTISTEKRYIHEVSCSCGGKNEFCFKCNGIGFHKVDQYGNVY